MSQFGVDLDGQAIGIWGFGREGVSMAKLAASHGAVRIDAVDDVGRLPFEEPKGIANLTVFRGSEHLTRLRRCDVVFISPGVPWRHPFFVELRGSNIRISSAADWFMSRHGGSTIGVTGTKGKSTTASFLGHLLDRLGVGAVVAGNIGTPLSDLTPTEDTVVVAELSSQQAALLSTSPAIAVLTNLYEDHLDWHGGTDAYHLAKANVFCNGARSLVTTSEVIATLSSLGITSLPPSVRLVDPATVRRSEGHSAMTYEHNVMNGALAAVAAGELIGRPITPGEMDAAVQTFRDLPHRLQTVRTTGCVRWIDDTLATTGESVEAALRAMPPDAHIALIVGGLDRQLGYERLDTYLRSGARRVSLIQSPSNGAAIGRGFALENPSRTHLVDSLEQAVRTAAALPDVDVVLLSPGAASYDHFANFEAKAAAYCGFIDACT